MRKARRRAEPSYEPNYEDGEEPLPEQQAEMDRKMQESIALNAQLKAMLAQAEADEALRQQQQRQLPGRRMAQERTAPGGRGYGGPPRAKNGGWGGTTFTEDRANLINRDNQILVSKLSNIAQERRRPLVDGPPVVRQDPSKSTVAINRRKQDDKIARENAAMARRLGSVKASKGLSVSEQAKHARQHQKHLSVLRQPTPGMNPLAAAPLPRRSPGARPPSVGPRSVGFGAAPMSDYGRQHRPFE